MSSDANKPMINKGHVPIPKAPKIIHAGISPSIFYYCYLVVKTQSSVEFKTQSSIFYYLITSYFIAIVKVLFLIHFKEGYIFSVFYSRSVFSSNLTGFESQNFYSIYWATMGPFECH